MTTYELPPEPPIGESVRDVHGRTWKHEGVNRWVLKDVDPAYRETRSWQQLFLSAPLTLIESDSWPTESLIVASVDGGGPQLLSIITRHAAVAMTSAIVRRAEHTLTNVVPVTVVPVAALPVLWSALEQWLNGNSDPDSDTNRLIGAVINLRKQIDALGVDL